MTPRKKALDKKTAPNKTAKAFVKAALAAERDRFRACVAARPLLPLLNADVRKHLKVKNKSSYTDRRWFRAWQQELLAAGFQFVKHFNYIFADYSAFMNDALRFDAYLYEGDKNSCQIVAYHSDQTVTVAANCKPVIAGEFAPPSRSWHEFRGASPAELVEHLKGLMREKKVMRIDADGCKPRFVETLNRADHETGQLAVRVLQTPTVLIDGKPPRWERVGCYFDFAGAGYKQPSFSTDNWVRDWQKRFAEAGSNPPDSTNDALHAAVWLVAASHLQFATAPSADALLAPACDVALAHFQSLAGPGMKETVAHATFQFRALLRGLLLCALAERWDTFKNVCDLAQPKLASAKTADDADLDFAQVLLLLVSSYRKRALPQAAALEQGVAKRLAKYPRLLLDIWRAIADGRTAAVDEALRNSLTYFMEERRGDKLLSAQRLTRKRWNDPFSYIALPESLFYLVARERGLELPPLEPKFADMLITPETIACAR